MLSWNGDGERRTRRSIIIFIRGQLHVFLSVTMRKNKLSMHNIYIQINPYPMQCDQLGSSHTAIDHVHLILYLIYILYFIFICFHFICICFSFNFFFSEAEALNVQK